MQYGLYGFGAMVVLTALMTVLALTWRAERDAFEVSDWKWRGLRQEDPRYATDRDGIMQDEPKAADFKQWVLKQEQAVAKREAAAEAARQAASMNAEADALEGKRKANGKKKQ
jgi:hypothetical protein